MRDEPQKLQVQNVEMQEYNQEILDLDLLHECATPPSEFCENYEGSREFYLHYLGHFRNCRNKRPIRRKKTPNVNHFMDEDRLCHQCLKSNYLLEYLKCSNNECGKYYCTKCIRKYPNMKFSECFVCQKICKCLACNAMTQLKQSTDNTHIEINVEKLKNNSNFVKIDDFVIVENHDEPEAEMEEEKQRGIEKDSKILRKCEKIAAQSKTQENEYHVKLRKSDVKMKKYVNRVEMNSKNERCNDKTQCQLCRKYKMNIIVFKSLDEFVFFVKHFLEEDEGSSFSRSRKEFNEYFQNNQKYDKNKEYRFQSMIYLCNDCLRDNLADYKGFYSLFNNLNIPRQIYQSAEKVKILEQSDRLISQRVEDLHVNADDIKKSDSDKNNTQTNCIARTNISMNTLQTGNISIPSINPFIPSKLFNSQTSSLLQCQSSMSLNNPDLTSIRSEQGNDNPCEKKEQELLNVTNIVMTIEHNKDKKGTSNPQTNLSTVLEELKKQFFSIQYYSLIQKLFISYIFKHMEMYMGNYKKNQVLAEFVMNNLLSSIAQSSVDIEHAPLLKEISDQVGCLKIINNKALALTTGLNSNFEELKSNGYSIFKGIDPMSGMNNISNDNELANIMESIKNWANSNNSVNGGSSNNNHNIAPDMNSTVFSEENLVNNINLLKSLLCNPHSSVSANSTDKHANMGQEKIKQMAMTTTSQVQENASVLLNSNPNVTPLKPSPKQECPSSMTNPSCSNSEKETASNGTIVSNPNLGLNLFPGGNNNPQLNGTNNLLKLLGKYSNQSNSTSNSTMSSNTIPLFQMINNPLLNGLMIPQIQFNQLLLLGLQQSMGNIGLLNGMQAPGGDLLNGMLNNLNTLQMGGKGSINTNNQIIFNQQVNSMKYPSNNKASLGNKNNCTEYIGNLSNQSEKKEKKSDDSNKDMKNSNINE